MYDGLQVLIHGDAFCENLCRKLTGFSQNVDFNGEVTSEYGRLANFEVKIRCGKYGKHATINGSLHRYFHSDNTGVFTYEDVCAAVNNLCRECEIRDSDNRIQSIEFGVNIPYGYPKMVIDSAILFNGRTPNRHPSIITRGKRNENPYKEWIFDQYSVKLYGKSSSIIRFELHIDDMRKVNMLGIDSLDSLKDPQIAKLCLQYLYRSIDSFLFVPLDREKCLPEDISSSWNSYRADSYWESIKTKQIKHRQKTIVVDAIAKFGLINWAQFLKKQIRAQAFLILGVDPWESLDTNETFSELGLQRESVAGPQGDGDRQTEENTHPDGDINIYTRVFHLFWQSGVRTNLNRMSMGAGQCNDCHCRSPTLCNLQNECLIDGNRLYRRNISNLLHRVYKAVYLSKFKIVNINPLNV